MKNIEEIFSDFNNNIFNRGMNSTECEKILKNNQVIIYGCGNSGTILYERLKKEKIEVSAFIDNEGSIYGKQFGDVCVFTCEEMLLHMKQDQSYVVLVALLDILSYESIKNMILEKLNLYNNILVFYFTQFRAYEKVFGLDKEPEFSAYLGENAEVLLENKEHIIHTYNMLDDPMSKKCYLELLNYYIVSDFIPFTVLPFREHYFAYDLYKKIKNEVFIDCGAYDGDTIDIFLENQERLYEKYIAIEADKVNYEKLLEKVSNIDNVKVIRSYISDERKEMKFYSQGVSYSRGGTKEGREDVIETITLDELVYQYKPTFLKINIEGADAAAILGAKRIIKEYKPIIAVQGHHKVQHLWEIVEIIENYSESEYKFYLRNYMGIDEFTFYAIPPQRLI